MPLSVRCPWFDVMLFKLLHWVSAVRLRAAWMAHGAFLALLSVSLDIHGPLPMPFACPVPIELGPGPSPQFAFASSCQTPSGQAFLINVHISEPAASALNQPTFSHPAGRMPDQSISP